MSFQAADLVVDPDGESTGHCECCGRATRHIQGLICKDRVCVATYHVHWTVDHLENDPTFDLVLGQWGDDAPPESRFVVSLFYRFSMNSFMVIDAQKNWLVDPNFASTGLGRDEVIGTPLAAQVFAIVDAIWLQDRRLFSSAAPGREDEDCSECGGALEDNKEEAIES